MLSAKRIKAQRYVGNASPDSGENSNRETMLQMAVSGRVDHGGKSESIVGLLASPDFYALQNPGLWGWKA